MASPPAAHRVERIRIRIRIGIGIGIGIGAARRSAAAGRVPGRRAGGAPAHAGARRRILEAGRAARHDDHID